MVRVVHPVTISFPIVAELYSWNEGPIFSRFVGWCYHSYCLVESGVALGVAVAKNW